MSSPEDIEKGVRLSRVLLKLQQEIPLSIEEEEFLYQCRNESGGEEEFNRVNDREKTNQRLGELLTIDFEELARYLIANIEREEGQVPVIGRKGGVRRLLLWAGATAAILLLICLGTYMWLEKTGKSKPGVGTHVQIQDIAAGSNKAQLILSDGSKLELADTTKVDISQGDGHVRGADGRLVYASGEGSNSPGTVFNTLIVPKAGTYKLMLSDGTQVWMNALSSLKFPVSFPGGKRIVELHGEAYFEVAQDSRSPFSVITDRQKVNVIGTSFNIDAYDSSKILTTLVEGTIKVGTGDKVVVLKPGQQSVNLSGDLKLNRQADLDMVLAWKNGNFLFKENSIEDIMLQVARWYDVDIRYAAKHPTDHFVGNLPRKDSLSHVLRLLELTGSVRFKIDGAAREVIVLPPREN